MPYGHPFGHTLGGGHWLAQAVLLVLVMALVALAVVALVHYLRSVPHSPATDTSVASPNLPTPEDILRMRLARGEISAEEYTSTMSTLAGTS
jgi:putative membrane protein